jgi:chemotaxis protein CheC
MIQSKELQKVHEEACLKSSAALAKLIGQQMIVDIVNPKAQKVKDIAPTVGLDKTAMKTAIIVVSLPARGKVEGNILLMFSQEDAFDLCDLLFKREPGTTKELTELDKSALQELGNIICGTYFSSLANHVRIKIVEHMAQITFDKPFETMLDQIIERLTPNREDVTALETEFNFSMPAFKGHLFKSYFLVLFQTAQLEMILNDLQEVPAYR